jgi:hypothetical protein
VASGLDAWLGDPNMGPGNARKKPIWSSKSVKVRRESAAGDAC